MKLLSLVRIDFVIINILLENLTKMESSIRERSNKKGIIRQGDENVMKRKLLAGFILIVAAVSFYFWNS